MHSRFIEFQVSTKERGTSRAASDTCLKPVTMSLVRKLPRPRLPTNPASCNITRSPCNPSLILTSSHFSFLFTFNSRNRIQRREEKRWHASKQSSNPSSHPSQIPTTDLPFIALTPHHPSHPTPRAIPLAQTRSSSLGDMKGEVVMSRMK